MSIGLAISAPWDIPEIALLAAPIRITPTSRSGGLALIWLVRARVAGVRDYRDLEVWKLADEISTQRPISATANADHPGKREQSRDEVPVPEPQNLRTPEPRTTGTSQIPALRRLSVIRL